MPTVTETITTNGSTAVAGATVKIRTYPGIAYHSAGDKSLIGQVSTTTDSNGTWSAALVACDLLNPAGTVYLVEVVSGTVRSNRFIDVPNTAGPFFVEDILTDQPGTVASSALQAHLDDTVDAHDASAISVVPFSTVAATTVQAALEELLAEAVGGGGATTLDGLSDVVITAAASGDVLRHNGSNWVDTPGTDHYEAAGAVTAHNNATTFVHGVLDMEALETKVAGIEELADVTDAANVAAAGAVMEADTSTASMSFVVDEDNMASDSATKLPTQQSVKAYVDAHTGDSSAAHAATAVSFTPAGTIAASTVQAAVEEVATDAASALSTHVAAADPHTGYVLESLYDANTILIATSDNTPIALTVAASTFVGRKASGDIDDMSAAEAAALLTALVAKATYPWSVTVALSDMTTQITTGTTKAYWVNPFDTTLTVTKVKATLATAGSGSTVVDVNEGAGAGTTILSTKITIDASETDSDDATGSVISDATIAADGRITFDIDTAGTSAAGLQVTLIGTRVLA